MRPTLTVTGDPASSMPADIHLFFQSRPTAWCPLRPQGLSSAVFWHPEHCCMGGSFSLQSKDVASHFLSPCSDSVSESLHVCPFVTSSCVGSYFAHMQILWFYLNGGSMLATHSMYPSLKCLYSVRVILRYYWGILPVLLSRAQAIRPCRLSCPSGRTSIHPHRAGPRGSLTKRRLS